MIIFIYIELAPMNKLQWWMGAAEVPINLQTLSHPQSPDAEQLYLI